jgi:hypothetical protein
LLINFEFYVTVYCDELSGLPIRPQETEIFFTSKNVFKSRPLHFFSSKKYLGICIIVTEADGGTAEPELKSVIH